MTENRRAGAEQHRPHHRRDDRTGLDFVPAGRPTEGCRKDLGAGPSATSQGERLTAGSPPHDRPLPEQPPERSPKSSADQRRPSLGPALGCCSEPSRTAPPPCSAAPQARAARAPAAGPPVRRRFPVRDLGEPTAAGRRCEVRGLSLALRLRAANQALTARSGAEPGWRASSGSSCGALIVRHPFR